MSALPAAETDVARMGVHPGRTHTCGALRSADVGRSVTLKGWVDTRRDLGGVIFIDLRDRFGLTQVVFSPQDDVEAHALADRLRSEWVVSVNGSVRNRSPETVNPNLPTGRIEVRAHDLEILAVSETLPFMVSAHGQKRGPAGEDLRLRYRYLDLRRPELQQRFVARHRVSRCVRRYFDEHGFLEIETPTLMRSTPEGARDYLVPSRIHPGCFYALPQSPQTYKQLLMVAGFDRYVQIVKCFRDEDLRADRQPEFTQIDVEMSFATEESVCELVEGLMQAIWKDVKGVNLATPFPRLTYDDALTRYGSDKPDLRFDLEIRDLSAVFEGSGFRVFDAALASGGAILGLVTPGMGSRGRGYLDKLDKQVVRRTIGAGGLIHVRIPPDGSDIVSSVKEHVLPRSVVERAIAAAGANAGDLLLVLSGAAPTVHRQMGRLRLHMASELDLIPEPGGGPWRFAWVTEFPLLEWDERQRRFTAVHHPFTSPRAEDIDLLQRDPRSARARAYDLVLNGNEIGGGSIRIHDAALQRRMFGLLGIDEQEAAERFGFLLEAFRYGAPPHGGIALGLDRIMMLLTGASSLRDVIAFPKTQSAQEPMSDTPARVDERQLSDLHVQLLPGHEA